MTATEWRSVDVHHHETDRTDLVLDAIRPFLAAIGPSVQRTWFQPHWRRGPHVRIPVQAGADVFASVVEPAVDAVLRPWVAAHPSTTVVDEDAMRDQHARLAEIERERLPLTPWVPDNTVVTGEHDRREHVLGEQASDLLADYYVDTTPIVFDMLDRVRGGASRMALAVDIFIGTAHRFLPPITYGYMSYRGHADAFLAKMPDAARARFDHVYEANAEHFRRRVADITAAEDYHGIVPFPELLDTLLRYRNQANLLLGSGDLRLNVDEQGRDEEWGSTWTAFADRSAFHRKLGGNRGAADQLGGWNTFQQYRVVLNWMYLNMYRLGLGELERNLVCHVVSRAVEDVHGVTADERIGDLISYVDAGGRL